MSSLIELQPKTPAGARLVACAEDLGQQMALDAEENDTLGRFPVHNVSLLKQARYFSAPIPEQFGGLGVESSFDILVASSRLARGDASTTLGVNMHLQIVSSMVRRWRVACHRGDRRRAAAFGQSLARIIDDDIVLAAAISEPNQHLTDPAVSAAHNGAGWVLNGRKVFCTMSPAATLLLVSTHYQDSAGDALYGYAEVPANAPGVTIHDDWDAMGMRASGSNSVSFEDVHVPETALRGGFPVGSALGYIERNLGNGLFHTAVSVGIAEAAHESAIARLRGRVNLELDAAALMLTAENAIALSAMRASFGRAAELVDDFYLEHLSCDAAAEEWQTLFAEVQAAKTFVGESAARIVDRALTLSGGAGYRRSHALSRAYRDVRAGSFMQPLSSLRAYTHLARSMLGLEPTLA
jgi:alkylation response protein AidB-like acyl-CoA dehydrogenase